jgi:hypothetical protein
MSSSRGVYALVEYMSDIRFICLIYVIVVSMINDFAIQNVDWKFMH